MRRVCRAARHGAEEHFALFLGNALERIDQQRQSAPHPLARLVGHLLRLIDGRENLVKARLALHSMKPAEVQKPVDEGMAIAVAMHWLASVRESVPSG